MHLFIYLSMYEMCILCLAFTGNNNISNVMSRLNTLFFVIMLSKLMANAHWHYAESRYADCGYTECCFADSQG